MRIHSLLRKEEDDGGTGGRVASQRLTERAAKTKRAHGEGLDHLIYLKQRGVVFFLITVKDGSCS